MSDSAGDSDRTAAASGADSPVTANIDELRFDANGLICAVVQQYDTGEVLMVAWMNAEAVRRTLESGRTWFWSRSRQEYWCKGETSGNTQRVIEVRVDCDADSLLVLVDQTGVACHTGERSCFFRTLNSGTDAPGPGLDAPGLAHGEDPAR